MQTEHCDVAVVGGGMAGLAAAWACRRYRVVLLEEDDRIGGRVRSERRDGYWLNLGAHLFGDDEAPVARLANAFDLELLPIPGAKLGLAIDGRIAAGGRIETYPLRLPLAPMDRLAFVKLGLTLRSGAARLSRVQRERPGETPQARRRRQVDFDNDRTLKDCVGRLTPRVERILSTITERTGACPKTMAAGYGFTSFTQVWSKKAFGRNLNGGSGSLPAAIAGRLDDVRTGASVDRVIQHTNGVEIEYRKDAKHRRIRARQAIIAVPADVAAAIIEDLPRETDRALRQIRYGPFLSVAVLTGEQGPMPWDNSYAIATPGLSFGVLFNQASTLRTGARAAGGSLMLFRGGPAAAALMDMTDDAIIDGMLDDLARLYPDARGIHREVIVQRWPRGAPYGFVGRARIQEALVRPLGRLHLAGDYLEFPCMDAAVTTALEASARVTRALETEAKTHGPH